MPVKDARTVKSMCERSSAGLQGFRASGLRAASRRRVRLAMLAGRGGLARLRRRLEAEGANELVLDLRDNRGGLVQEGIEIAKLFLPGGTLAA